MRRIPRVRMAPVRMAWVRMARVRPAPGRALPVQPPAIRPAHFLPAAPCPAPLRAVAWFVAALGVAFAGPPARAFLGIGDTSFVTVIANPAEAANWAAQLEQLSNAVAAARAMADDARLIRIHAGDPAASSAGAPTLSDVLGAMDAVLAEGPTVEALSSGWTASSSAQRNQSVLALLGGATGIGSGQMRVFGVSQPRNLQLYAPNAADAIVSGGIRSEISDDQSARASIGARLSDAWGDYRQARTQSDQQAALTRISQLQSQNSVMDARRRALLDDLAISDRQRQAAAETRTQARDEQALAESAALQTSLASRAQAAEDQRLATASKAPGPPAAADYSGLRVWTTADAAGGGL